MILICQNDPFDLTIALTTGTNSIPTIGYFQTDLPIVDPEMSAFMADPAAHHGVWTLTITETPNGCTGTDDIAITIKSCSHALNMYGCLMVDLVLLESQFPEITECGSMSEFVDAGESTVYGFLHSTTPGVLRRFLGFTPDPTGL